MDLPDPHQAANWVMLGTVTMKTDTTSSTESPDFGMPYPWLTYLYQFQQKNENL